MNSEKYAVHHQSTIIF